jgi:cytidine deaminase
MEEIIEYAKKRYNEIRIIQKNNKYDEYFAVVKSNSGKYYDSTPLHNHLCPICCERSAMAQMVTNEGNDSKVIELVLVGAIGTGGTLTPCGICRQIIYDNSPDAKIIVCSGKFGKNEDCNFIFDKPIYYSVKDLLPHAWTLGEW